MAAKPDCENEVKPLLSNQVSHDTTCSSDSSELTACAHSEPLPPNHGSSDVFSINLSQINVWLKGVQRRLQDVFIWQLFLLHFLDTLPFNFLDSLQNECDPTKLYSKLTTSDDRSCRALYTPDEALKVFVQYLRNLGKTGQKAVNDIKKNRIPMPPEDAIELRQSPISELMEVIVKTLLCMHRQKRLKFLKFLNDEYLGGVPAECKLDKRVFSTFSQLHQKNDLWPNTGNECLVKAFQHIRATEDDLLYINQFNGKHHLQPIEAPRLKKLCKGVIRPVVVICFIFVLVMAFSSGFGKHLHDTMQMKTDSKDVTIHQNDTVLLSIGTDGCFQSEAFHSVNISELLPSNKIKVLNIYKHIGSQNSIKNHSVSIAVSPNVILPSGSALELYPSGFYAASYTHLDISTLIIDVTDQSDPATLTLFVLDNKNDIDCFNNDPHPSTNCDYMKRFSLNATNGSSSHVQSAFTQTGYYFVYFLAEGAELYVSYNDTSQYNYYDSSDFGEPVCSIQNGGECESILFEKDEGMICLLLHAVPGGSSNQYFAIKIGQDYRLRPFDNTNIALLVVTGSLILILVLFIPCVILCKKVHDKCRGNDMSGSREVYLHEVGNDISDEDPPKYE